MRVQQGGAQGALFPQAGHWGSQPGEGEQSAQPLWWQVSPWAQMVAFFRGPEPRLVRDQAGGLPSLVSGSHQAR